MCWAANTITTTFEIKFDFYLVAANFLVVSHFHIIQEMLYS